MRVAIFRTEVHVPRSAGPKLAPRLSFTPIEPDLSRGIVGSGLVPWKRVDIPLGTRIAVDGCTGESVLYLPGESRPLTAGGLASRLSS